MYPQKVLELMKLQEIFYNEGCAEVPSQVPEDKPYCIVKYDKKGKAIYLNPIN